MEKLNELNKLFNSSNPDEILKFYNNFKTARELITWSKNRPRGKAKIYTVKGDTDLIIVIPTTNRNGKLAKNCENNVFKGQEIVFIESGLDPFFNYARNSNIGLRYALRYKPKWIVLSNDDVQKVDDIHKLKTELSILDNNKIKIVTAKDLTDKLYLGKPIFTNLAKLHYYIHVLRHKNLYPKPLKEYARIYKNYLNVLKKYSPNYKMVINDIPRKKLFFKKIRSFNGSSFFFILSPYLIKAFKGNVFDEVFINGVEDHELFLRTDIQNKAIVNFKIKQKRGGGQTLGKGVKRVWIELFGLIYLNELLKRTKK